MSSPKQKEPPVDQKLLLLRTDSSMQRISSKATFLIVLAAHLANDARHEAGPKEGYRNAQGHLIQANVAHLLTHDADVADERQAAAARRTGASDGSYCCHRGGVQL